MCNVCNTLYQQVSIIEYLVCMEKCIAYFILMEIFFHVCCNVEVTICTGVYYKLKLFLFYALQFTF